MLDNKFVNSVLPTPEGPDKCKNKGVEDLKHGCALNFANVLWWQIPFEIQDDKVLLRLRRVSR
jgi:hypothetical protein